MKKILLLLTCFFFASLSFAQTDLVVTNTNNQDVYVSGTSAVYTITVTNFGPNAATNVHVVSPIPAGITTYYWEGSNFSFGSNADAVSSLDDVVPTMAAGEVVTYTLNIEIPLAFSGPLTSTVNVSMASPTDINTSSNESVDNDMQANSDVSIVNTDFTNTYVSGQNSVYTLTVHNNGPTDAVHVVVKNAVPVGIAAANFSWTGSNGSSGTGVAINDIVELIGVGEDVVYTVTISVPADFAAILINKATVYTTSADPTMNDHESTDTDVKAFGADIKVVNTDNQDFYIPGQPRVYTLTVTNAGPEVATEVHVYFPAPDGTTITSWSGTNSSSGTNNLDNTIATLAVGTTVTYTITVNVPSDFTGDLTTQATVTASQPDANPCDRCIDIDTAGADIQVSNTDNKATYISGESQAYTVVVTNNGPAAAENVHVSNVFPTGVSIVSWTGSNGINGSGSLDDIIPSLANGASVTYTVNVTVLPTFTGNLTSQVTVTSDTEDPVPACSGCTDTDTKALADISITNTDGTATYNTGVLNSKTYTVTVTNNGPSNTRNLGVTFAVPAGATQVSWTGSNGTSGTGAISTVIASLANGASVVYTVVLQIPATFTGNFTTTATVSSAATTDNTAPNNTAADTDTPQNTADVVVVNTNNQEVYITGVSTIYTVSVTNNGPAVATGVHVTFPLPAGISSMSWTGNSAGAPGALDNTITTMAVGQTVIYTVTVNIPASFTGNLTAQANIVSTTSIDPVTTCAQCTDIDTAGTPQADVVITNTDNQSFYTTNSTAVYTVTVTNNGPQSASQVHIQNPLPTGITTMSWTASNGSSGNGAIDVTIPTLGNGASIVYTITVTIPSSFSGNLVNTATVSTTPVDSSTANNTATDTDVPAASDIVVTNIASNASPVRGTMTDFTITVTNNGPQAASGINVANALPVGVTVMSWTGSNGSSGTGALSNVIQYLGVGSSVTYTVTIQVPYSGATSINSTAISTLATDPNTANSQSTATLTLSSPNNDVGIGITDGFATYIAGQSRVYTVTVTNLGSVSVSNVAVSSIVPQGIANADYTWSGNSGSGNGAINNTIATLNAGQTVTYTITINVPSGFPQDRTLVASVSAVLAADPQNANNTATDMDAPGPSANLSVKKTDNSATYEQSRDIDDNIYDTDPAILVEKYVTYTITVVNYGPSDSFNIVVTDNIPVNTNVAGTQITASNVTWSGNGASGTGVLSDTIDHLAVGEIVTYTVKVYIPEGFQVYSTPQVDSNLINTVTVSPQTPDPVIANNTSTDVDIPAPKFMYVSNDPVKYSVNHQLSGLAQGLIENVLIRSHCADVSNFQMWSKDGNNSNYGIGYFNKLNSDFPIEDGLILLCGGLMPTGGDEGVPGPNDTGTVIDGPDWPGSSDFNPGYMTPGVGIGAGTTNDQSYLQFDFVPSAQEMSFNFIFASEEYSRNGFECTYSDVFAFILTDQATPTVHKNLAVIPNTTIPVKVTSIHLPGCDGGQNPQYFGKYNWDPANATVAANAAHGFNGQTENLVAKSTVIPGHTYTIKLIIANQGDHALASGVFIQGGSFKFEAKVTGQGTLSGIDEFTGDYSVCDGQSRIIQYGNEPLPNATYAWQKNGVKIEGADDYFYEVSEDGIYKAIVTFTTGCQKSDEIEVNFTEPLPTNLPKDIAICDNEAPYVFNIDQTNFILNNFSAADFPIGYYETEQDARDDANDILTTTGNLDQYTITDPNFVNKTIWVRIANMGAGSGCVDVRPVVLSRQFSEGEISYPAGLHCIGNGTVAVTPSDNFTPGGYYEATPSGLGIDFLTGEINLDSSQAGSYTVKYKIPEGTCPAYESQPVTFDVSACLATTITPRPAVCAGDTFDLQTSAVNQPGVTYTWSDANGVIATTNVPQLDLITAPTTAGSYDYTVVANLGAESSEPSTLTLVVHGIPTATISGPNNVCTNGNADILISGTPGASVTYNDGTSDTMVTLNAAGEYPFTVAVSAEITFQLGAVASATNPICSQTLNSASPNSSLTITVGLPDAEITGPANAIFCEGGSTDITVSGASDATVHYTITNSSGTTNGPPLLLNAAGEGTITATGLTENTTYTLIDVTTSCFNTITDESLLVTVHPSPGVTSFSTSTPTVCEDTQATLNFTGTPGATINYKDNLNNTYNVLIPASGNATQQTPPISDPTTFTLVNVVSADLCTTDLNLTPVAIAVARNPVITSQPNTPATICETQSFTITVQATGTDLHYTWYHDNVAVVPPVDSNVYTKVSTFSDNGDYSVEISGQCTPPAAIAVSNTVHVTIHDLHISSQPVVLTEVCPDDDVTLEVQVQGSGTITYEWRKEGNPIPGANSSQLLLDGVLAADAGIYTCLVSNGTCSILSEEAEVRVHVAPSISVHPIPAVDKCTSPTDSFTLSVTADGTAPLSYVWTRDGQVVGGNSPTLTITPLTLADAGQYKVVVTGLCGFVESTPTQVNITEAPAIVSQPSSPELCSGPGNTLFLHVGVTGGGSDVHYQWLHNNVEVGTDSPDYSVTVPAVSDSGTYICRISNGVCSPIFTDPLIVVVNQAPVITQQPVSRTVCVDELLTLFVEVQTTIPVHYHWFHNGVEVGDDAPTYSVGNAALDDAGTYRCDIISDTCPMINSNTVTVAVRPLPDATISNGAQSTICDNTGTDVIFTGTPNAIVTYTVNGGEEQTITLNPSGSARLLTGVLGETTTYSLVSVAANDNPPCPKILDGEAVVTVLEIPDPELDQDGYICLDPTSGQTMAGSSYELNTGLTTADGYTFVWYLDDVEIQGATEGTYEAVAAGTYEVEITDTATGCTDSATAPIVTSTPPLTITADVVTGYFEENATVVVTADPPGEYEYRLDDGPWQTDNVFTGVRTVLSINTTGDHTVYVRDTKACDELSYDVKVIDYPKYFTPNGDGFHDTWNISVLSNQPNAKIYIFDRFGKLLKQISTTNPTGWDGTYNGQPMSADDYWFVVKYMEQGINKEFRAHFTLKR